jgi:hypothetical protein
MCAICESFHVRCLAYKIQNIDRFHLIVETGEVHELAMAMAMLASTWNDR